MNNNRYKYLDGLKTIAIFFVCIYHFWFGANWGSFGFLNEYLYSALSTCVPMLMAVNGALLLNKQDFHAEKHFKKVFKIVGQYYIWHIITAIIVTTNAGIDLFSVGKAQLINSFLLMQAFPGFSSNHFWFIPVLCCIYLLYPFLLPAFRQEHMDRNSRLALIVLMAVSYFCNFFINDFEYIKFGIPYLNRLTLDGLCVFDSFRYYLGTMLVYFLIGGFLHKYRQKLNKIPSILFVAMIIVGLTLSYIIVYITKSHGIYYDAVFDGYGTTGTFFLTVGAFLLLTKAEDKIPEQGVLAKILHFVGRNTMTIYYTHVLLGRGVLLHLPMGSGLIWNLLAGSAMLGFGVFIGETMKKIPVLKFLIYG